ncbi:LCP family protein [Candidatus Saccharibacteria bacterium]|nr:MAG: LCP family protein [Candidatus Saccharibacteria bacterium]
MKTNTTQSKHVPRASLDGFNGTRNIHRVDYAGLQPTSRVPVTQQYALAETLAPKKPIQLPQQQQEADVPQFDLPKYVAPERPKAVVKKRTPWKRHILRTLAASTALCLLFAGVLFWRGYVNIHKVFRGNNTVAALSAEKVAPELLRGEGDGRVNILMLGAGGENHPGGDLTDTIMVLSVDPVNKTAAMLSVPRDLWVKMPVNYFGAYQKINAAYSSGKYKYLGKTDLKNDDQQAIEAGFASASEAVSGVLGIKINYHVLVDFQAFEQAIDTVGGVSVDVKEQLYDPTMAWENANNPVLAPAGSQNMQGKQALMYARSRETSSDFARSERQRQLLVALKEKVLTLGTLSSPARIDSLMDSFGGNVRTDLSTQAASRLFSIMKGIADNDVASLSLTTPQSLVTTDRVGDASVVRPKAGFNTYSDIQTYVRSQLLDGYLVKEKAHVYVIGSSEKLRSYTEATLAGYGYNVSGSSVMPTVPPGMTVVDLSNAVAPYTLHYLQDRYGVAATKQLPHGVEVPSGTQFVIITGT